jgi:CDP-glucose 4,6-dehydratase
MHSSSQPLNVSSLQHEHSFANAFAGKRVLVTGHTGFKGSWLCEWLLSLGADLTGFSLPPPTSPSLFEQLQLRGRMNSIEGDIRDLALLGKVVKEGSFDFVFHLAAQPLVRLSYAEPVQTYATNVMGTVHLLEAVRQCGRSCSVIVVTTDKCYDNKEWVHGYREEDPLGGYDPYSSSKGAAELVVAAYRRSFFSESASGTGNLDTPRIRVASARAGNVIGGGDWAQDRILPDCIRALEQGKTIPVRNKVATRPWQHVLEPLSGYLWLGAVLSGSAGEKAPFPAQIYTSPFNFGPNLSSNKTVAELVQEVLQHWPGRWEDCSDPKAPHEAKLLNLTIDKAHHFLGWTPVWDFQTTLRQTVEWYKTVHETPSSATSLTRKQIEAYELAARQKGLAWA